MSSLGTRREAAGVVAAGRRSCCGRGRERTEGCRGTGTGRQDEGREPGRVAWESKRAMVVGRKQRSSGISKKPLESRRSSRSDGHWLQKAAVSIDRNMCVCVCSQRRTCRATKQGHRHQSSRKEKGTSDSPERRDEMRSKTQTNAGPMQKSEKKTLWFGASRGTELGKGSPYSTRWL